MRATKRENPQTKRLFTAVTFVLLLFGLLFLTEIVESSKGSVQTAIAQESEGIVFDTLRFGANPSGTLDEIEANLSRNNASVPEFFQSEIGMPAGAQNVRVDATASVIGWDMTGGSQVVLEAFIKQMENKGWSSVPLGGVCGATFLKDEGQYRWALVSCSQFDSTTSVVLRTVPV